MQADKTSICQKFCERVKLLYAWKFWSSRSICDDDTGIVTWYGQHLHSDIAVSRTSLYTSLGKYSVLLIEYNVTSVDSIAGKVLLDLQFPHT